MPCRWAVCRIDAERCSADGTRFERANEDEGSLRRLGWLEVVTGALAARTCCRDDEATGSDFCVAHKRGSASAIGNRGNSRPVRSE
eukprot:1193589-Prorocentrum_minimum.AAC.1